MRTLSFLLAAGVAAMAPAAAQSGPGPQATGFIDQLRATGCPDGYWLQAQAAPERPMPAGMLAQPGRRQVVRCVGLAIAVAPVCPAGAGIAVQPGTDACTAKAGLSTPVAKPQPPTCAAPAKLKPDAGAGGADLCIETRIVAPEIAIQLALPWGFTL